MIYTFISFLNLFSCFKVSNRFAIAVSALPKILKIELVVVSSHVMLGVEIVDDLSKRDSFIFLEYSVCC